MSNVKYQYYNSTSKDKSKISKLIDRLPTGSGLMESDIGKW